MVQHPSPPPPHTHNTTMFDDGPFATKHAPNENHLSCIISGTDIGLEAHYIGDIPNDSDVFVSVLQSQHGIKNLGKLPCVVRTWPVTQRKFSRDGNLHQIQSFLRFSKSKMEEWDNNFHDCSTPTPTHTNVSKQPKRVVVRLR